MKNSKTHNAHSKRNKRRKKSETERYFIDGEWITAEERAAEISRLKASISQIEAMLSICGQAFKVSKGLIDLARAGHKLPVHVLCWIACDPVTALSFLVDEQPELVPEISRGLFCWPAFISRKRMFKEHNAELMDRLQLGRNSDYSKRKWQLSAPSTQAAVYLFETAQFHKREWDLPPLTEKNKMLWFEVSWNYMLREGIVPEETPSLVQLGKSAVGKKSTARGMSEQTEGMRRDDVRAEIKRQVRDAFNRLIAGAEK